MSILGGQRCRYAPEDFGREQDIYVGDRLVLRIRPEFEKFRAKQMSPLLDRHAMKFEPSPYDSTYPHKDPQGVCYNNAAETALQHNLIYCEGLMLFLTPTGEVMPLSHGWCCKPDGTIVDSTCPKYQNTNMIRYIGIPIKREYLLWWYEQTGYYGLLDGHHQYAPMGVYHDDPAHFVQLIAKE